MQVRRVWDYQISPRLGLRDKKGELEVGDKGPYMCAMSDELQALSTGADAIHDFLLAEGLVGRNGSP